MKIPKELVPTIKKLQVTLGKIDRKEPVFFGIVDFQEKGLVHGIDRYYTNAYGNKERLKTDWYLTDKGKQILNTIL